MAFSNNSMADEIKKEESVVTPTETANQSTVPDYEALYKEAAERARKAQEDARNFRKGYEKYKEIAKDKAPDGDSISELVQQEVQRALADSQAERENASLHALNLQMAKELKEAKLALASKGSITGAGAGSGEGSMPVPTNDYLSKDQINELKKKGFSDEKIAKVVENMKKLKSA